METEIKNSKSFISSIVGLFLNGPLSIIFIVAGLLLGLSAVIMTPREEEPQIVVPMVDILVDFPGHSAKEVEQLVTTPLERLLWQVGGVEHVYSTSYRDRAMVIVRFHVGEDYTSSMVKIRDKMDENMGLVHPGVRGWQVNPVEIDDVPVLSFTFFSDRHDIFEIRRMTEELKARLDSSQDIFQSEITGGSTREIIIEPDPEKLAAYNISINDIITMLRRTNNSGHCGFSIINGKNMRILAEASLKTVDDVKNTVMFSNENGGVLRLAELAKINDAPREHDNYTEISFGPAAKIANQFKSSSFPCVTLSFSKKKGVNSVSFTKQLIKRAEELKTQVMADDVQMLITRNYGETANDKVNDLLSSLAFAMITVVGLLAFTMGWREALIVGLAVPLSFSFALFVNLVAGYTINRVTLFALILSLGMVVDDPITNVDNIQRHIRTKILDPLRATLFAVDEVLPPVILSTIAIIISFTPMFFITGMMGPYMRPMAINVPVTVTFSTVCALTFVPFLALFLLKNRQYSALDEGKDPTPLWIRKGYAFLISPFFKKRNAYLFLFLIFIATILSAAIMLKVPLKMLPFDNKNELQVLIDMPEGTTLEETVFTAKKLSAKIATYNEVKNCVIYAGTNSPIDFNGLVRHYYMRKSPHHAEIRINMAEKKDRLQQSHAIALRIRDELTKIAEEQNALIRIIEVPPGPPVLSTLTIEIYGKSHHAYKDLIQGADEMMNILRKTDPKHIKEIDNFAETEHSRLVFEIDRDKASTHNITISDIYDFLRSAIEGDKSAGSLHEETERNPLIINVRLPLKTRTAPEKLSALRIRSASSRELIPLSELGKFVFEKEEQPIYHKNLEPVAYVTAETVGNAPGEIIFKILYNSWNNFIPELFKAAISGKWQQNLSNGTIAEWNGEGEWEVTTRVFRDLGIAFAVALVGIFILLVAQTNNIIMPIVIMLSIPLTIIGVGPGFYLLNFFAGKNYGGYDSPVFFTATGMIGMIALGGIVIRNSIVLIEFIEDSLKRGKSIHNAVLESGAVRFRPIMLTALTTMLGSWPITLDPIFSGLAWSLIFGLLASTAFTLFVIPIVYMLINNKSKST